MSQFIARAQQFWTWNHLLEVIGDIEHIAAFVVAKIKHGAKRLMYWVTVFAIGVALSAVILQIGGVSVAPHTAGAQSITDAVSGGWNVFVFYILGTWLGLVLFVLITLVSVMAFLLSIMIQYPWGPFWNSWVTAGAGDYTTGGYINIATVIVGWKAVRDVCNLFFAIILLVIALATALNIEAYKWQEMLRKLVLYAVLINFSRTIAGFFTDAATVVMATFGSNITENFAGALFGNLMFNVLGSTVGNLASGTGAVDASSASAATSAVTGTQWTSETQSYSILAAFVGSAFVAFFGLVIFTVFLVILIARVVFIWLLVVLSPIAYVTRILPNTAKYSQQWWEMFGRWVLIGPLITFFLWLVIVLLNGGTPDSTTSTVGGTSASNPLKAGFSQQGTSAAPTTGSTTSSTSASSTPAVPQITPSVWGQMLLTLVMLFAALKFATQSANEIAGQLSTVQGAATSFGNSVRRSAILKTSGIAGALTGNGQAAWNRYTSGQGGLLKDGIRGGLWRTADYLSGSIGDAAAIIPNVTARAQAKLEQGERKSTKDTEEWLASPKTLSSGRMRAAEDFFRHLVTGVSMHDIQGASQRGLFGSAKYAAGALGRMVTGDSRLNEAQALKDSAKKMSDARAAALPTELAPQFDNIKGANTLEEVEKQLRAQNQAQPVLDAKNKAKAAQEMVLAIQSGKAGQMLEMSDPVVSGTIAAKIQDFTNAANSARAGGDNDAAAKFDSAKAALSALQGTASFSFGDLQSAIAGAGVTAGLETAFGLNEDDSAQKRLESGFASVANAADGELKNALRTTPLQLTPGGAVIDLSSEDTRRALQQFVDRKKDVDAAEKKYATYVDSEIEKGRILTSPAIQQSADAALDEIAKPFEGVQDQRANIPFLKQAIEDGNTDTVMALLRMFMKQGNMGFALEGIQQYLDTNSDFAQTIKDAIQGNIDKGDKNFESLLDANGNVRLIQGREFAEIVRSVLLKDKLGMSDTQSFAALNGLSSVAIANGQVPYMALVNRKAGGEMELNSAEIQAHISTLIAAGGKGSLDVLRSLGLNSALARDASGNAVQLQAGFRNILQQNLSQLNNKNAKNYISSSIYQAIAGNEKLYQEVIQIAGANHEISKTLSDVRKNIQRFKNDA